MAKLSNINGKFAVEDTGAIRFSDQTGTTGQILKSNGNSAPTWVDPNTVGTGPWLPLAGGIVSGSTTFQSGLTVGGTLAVNGNLDVTSTSSDAVFLRSSQATTTNVYITNTNATANNTANLYFAPANNIAGSYIKSTAIEDFSTSANRTSDLRFAVRKDGTFNEAIIINSSGNVGIGTDSPSSKLHVDSGAAHGEIRLTTSTAAGYDATLSLIAGTSGGISILNLGYNGDDDYSRIFRTGSGDLRFDTNNAERMRIDSSGNINIGTGAASDTYVRIYNASTGDITAGYQVYNGSNLDLNIYTNPLFGNSTLLSREALAIRTGGSQSMFIDSNRNVTVNNGGFFLNKSDGAYMALKHNNSLKGYLGIANQVITGGSTEDIGLTATSNLIFGSGGTTERMRIDSSGNVGIGVTSDVAVRTFIKGSDSGTNNFQILTRNSNDENVLAVRNDGNVGIGTTSPDFALDIEVVDTGVQLQLGRTNTNVGSAWMGASGSGFAVGVGAYGVGNSLADPKGFLIDASGNLSTRRRIQAKTDTGVGVAVTRNLFVTYGGASYNYTFDPVALFGANKSGGTLGLRVSGWPTRLFDGIIVWRNDGGGSSVIGSGVVTLVQIATNDFSGVGVTVSLPSSSTNEITISFTGWHSNDHGWSCYIKNDF